MKQRTVIALMIKLPSYRGFSLIELMVAMVIGLVMSLAIYGVVASSEGRKRTTTAVNDIDQSATYALYQIDKYVRSAGAGFTGGAKKAEAYNITYGCPIRMVNGGSQILPTGSFVSPFNGVTGSMVMAPVIIADGAAPNGDDAIITMNGNSGFSELATDLTATPTANTLTLKNIVSFKASDVLLIAQKLSIGPCMIEQVDPTFKSVAGDTTLPLAGTYYQKIIAGTDLTQFNTTAANIATVLNLGQEPTMLMFAVGDNNTLFKYNLLNPAAGATKDDPNPGPFVEGIYRMHAIYGIDTTNTNQITWVAPTGSYSMANLTDGTTAARDRLRSIKALRIGMVAKAALPEKQNVSPSSIVLFANGPAATQVTVTLDAANYRYKTFETTIPIRNALFVSQ